MDKSLFNIEEDYLLLMRDIEANEGELTPELEERLTIVEADCERKIKAYHHIIKNNEGEIQIIKDEKERLSSLANTKENVIKRLKERVLNACQLFGYDGKSDNKKLDYDTLKVYTVNKDKIDVQEEYFLNSARQAIETNQEIGDDNKAFVYQIKSNFTYSSIVAINVLLNSSKIPELTEFIKSNPIMIEPVINKTKILEVIESGIKVPFAEKVNNTYINFR